MMIRSFFSLVEVESACDKDPLKKGKDTQLLKSLILYGLISNVYEEEM